MNINKVFTLCSAVAVLITASAVNAQQTTQTVQSQLKQVNNDKFTTDLQKLLKLEYEALETYVAAINRVEKEEYKQGLNRAKADHERHIKEISDFLKSQGAEVPTGPSGMQVLSIGKVAIANLIGDQAILKAMVQLEKDVHEGYEGANQHGYKADTFKSFLKKGIEDAHRNREWLERSAEK